MMTVTQGECRGEGLITGSDASEAVTCPVAPSPWSPPVGFLDTNGGIPLEITYEIESEDEEEERHCREALEHRGDEPTLSTEEVERELKKDGLL